MNIQDCVPSLELCKELKEKGFPQEVQFYWMRSAPTWDYRQETWGLYNRENLVVTENGIAAPLTGELLAEFTGQGIEVFLRLDPITNPYSVMSLGHHPYWITGNSLCEVVARLWLAMKGKKNVNQR